MTKTVKISTTSIIKLLTDVKYLMTITKRLTQTIKRENKKYNMI